MSQKRNRDVLEDEPNVKRYRSLSGEMLDTDPKEIEETNTKLTVDVSRPASEGQQPPLSPGEIPVAPHQQTISQFVGESSASGPTVEDHQPLAELIYTPDTSTMYMQEEVALKASMNPDVSEESGASYSEDEDREASVIAAHSDGSDGAAESNPDDSEKSGADDVERDSGESAIQSDGSVVESEAAESDREEMGSDTDLDPLVEDHSEEEYIDLYDLDVEDLARQLKEKSDI
eukprot:938266_1